MKTITILFIDHHIYKARTEGALCELFSLTLIDFLLRRLAKDFPMKIRQAMSAEAKVLPLPAPKVIINATTMPETIYALINEGKIPLKYLAQNSLPFIQSDLLQYA